MSMGNIRYSEKVISKLVVGKDGTERMYKARKISAFPLAKEGFKLIKVFAPMLGTGADSMIAKHAADEEFIEVESNTFGNMLTMLSAHLGDDHFEDLIMKVMGSLMIGDKEITDLDEHFDKYAGDFIEVSWWLLQENFKSFFTESAMIHSLIEKTVSLASPKLKDIINNFKKEFLEDPSSK